MAAPRGGGAGGTTGRLGDRRRHGRNCEGAGAAAGALLTPNTLARAAALGIEPRARLADNDGHGFFQALGNQLVTGPTLTNVNDFRAILILPTVA